MRRTLFIGILLIGTVVLLSFGEVWLSADDPDQSQLTEPYSPEFILYSPQTNGLFVAEVCANRIDYLDITTGQLHHGKTTIVHPSGLTWCEKRILVTSHAEGEGFMHLIDPLSLAEEECFPAGPGARSPVYSKSRKLIAICHTWKDEVGIYQSESGKILRTIKVLRQPNVCVLSPDEKYLFVANFLTHQRADRDTVASAVSVINLETLQLEKNILLANGSNALRGMAVSSDGKYIYITHNLGRFQIPTTQLEQGWMNTSALSVIRIDGLRYEGTLLLDEPDYGAAGSWGISAMNGQLVVAHSGTHDISVIDEEEMLRRLEATSNRSGLSYDLNFLGEIRTRIPLAGNGPRAVLQTENQIFAAMFFTDNVVELKKNDTQFEQKSIPLNQGFVESTIRLGEKYFHDAEYCFQGWQSCTGCHPMDARTDGLNWDLLNDGIGNPKNCKSLLLAHQTPPAMITGIRPDAETAVRAGFRYIQFANVSESHAQAVDDYLSSLHPEVSPFRVKGKLSRKARSGQKVFTDLGCQECHSTPWYTDGKMHAFTGVTDTLGEQTWDTPTLVEVWRTGPWLHDGRCATMEEVFSMEKHGITKELSEKELEELVEYVLSL